MTAFKVKLNVFETDGVPDKVTVDPFVKAIDIPVGKEPEETLTEEIIDFAVKDSETELAVLYVWVPILVVTQTGGLDLTAPLTILLNNILQSPGLKNYYAIAPRANAPYQVVPPLTVKNVKISIPDDCKVGTVPLGHFVPDIQFCVPAPPFVKIKVKVLETPEALGLVTDQVTVPVAVAVITPPRVKSIVCPPDTEPLAFTVSPYFII